MSGVDWREPVALLRTAFASDDWIAVLMKSYHTGETAQRILPLDAAVHARFLASLRAKNASRWEIYVGTNALVPNQRSRTRDAIRTVRHVFLDADGDGQALLNRVSRRADVRRAAHNRGTVLGRGTQPRARTRLPRRARGGDGATTRRPAPHPATRRRGVSGRQERTGLAPSGAHAASVLPDDHATAPALRRESRKRPGQGRATRGPPSVPSGRTRNAGASPRGSCCPTRAARGEEAVHRGVDRGARV